MSTSGADDVSIAKAVGISSRWGAKIRGKQFEERVAKTIEGGQ